MFTIRTFRRRITVASVAAISIVTMAACSSSSTPSTASSTASATSTAGSAAAPASAPSGGAVPSGTKAPAGNVKILFQTGSQQAALTALATKFGTENPGATATVEFVPPANYQQTLLTRLRSGSGPDVFYTNGGSGQVYSVVPLEKAGQLADLSSQPWAAALPAAAKPLYTVNGKVWALPLALVPIGLAYNTAAFAASGAAEPTTYPGLLAACKTAAAKNTPLISVAGSVPANAGIFAQIIAASTVYAANPNWNADRSANKVTFAGTAGWKTALQEIVDMKNAGCLLGGSEGQGVPAMFSSVGNSQAISLPGPAGVINAVKAITPTLKFGLWPFPGATATDTRATVGYSDAFGVNAKSPSLGTAEAFLNFMAQPANAKSFADAGATISLPDAAAGTTSADLGSFGTFIKNQQVASLPNLQWVNGDVYNALGTGVQGLLTGQLTPDAILTQMDTAWAKGAATG